MLRTMSLIRTLSWGGFAGLAFFVATAAAPAQEVIQMPKDAPPPQPLGAKDIKSYTLQINITKTFGMTRAPGAADDPILEKAQNENPKIVRVQIIQNDPRHILVTGVSPGTSRLTLTGYTDPTGKDRHDEIIEIRVPSDDEPVREQQRKDFIDLVRKTAPTASVDAVVGPNNTVFVTGNVHTADTVLVVLDAARAIFGTGVIINNGMRVGGVQQVEIDVQICSVNRSKIRNMSFSWSLNRKDFFINSILGSGAFSNSITTGIANAAATQASSGGNIVFGAVNQDGAFFGFLQALRTDGFATIQAEPKVVTLSGRPAQFVSGGETPILTTSGQGAPNVTYKTFGTTITVLPIILGGGKIHLEIAPLISTLNQANGITIVGGNSNVQVPGFNTQGAQVSIQLEDGQTIAIGGLIQHTRNATNSKVPVLGDIPFLGAAFRTVNYNENEQELIILVTPRLIDPMDCTQLPARLPTRLTRSPDDFELYLEGLLELPRGQRQTCGPDGCYQASHKLGPTAGMFPCGDQGSCGFGGYGYRTPICGPNGCRPGFLSDTCATTTTTTTAIPAATKAPVPAPMPTTMPPVAPIAPPPPMSVAPRAVESSTTSLAPPTELPPPSVAPVSYNAVPAETPLFPPLRVGASPLLGTPPAH
jgi:pilus assembly protein CpaC